MDIEIKKIKTELTTAGIAVQDDSESDPVSMISRILYYSMSNFSLADFKPKEFLRMSDPCL